MSNETLTLAPPAPVAPVKKEQTNEMVKLEQPKMDELDAHVAQFVEEVVAAGTETPDFKEKVDSIHNMGREEIKASAGVSNRMLERPVESMGDNGFFTDGSNVGKSLIDLRQQVEDLDPGSRGNLLAPRKLFGFIPWGSRIRDYFDEYRSAQDHINAIIESLYSGQDELEKDNAAIEVEKANLWAIMQKLRQYIYLGQKIDDALVERVAEIEAQDAHKAKVIKEDMLFYVRQKIQDLQTQLAVSIQGYLAMDMIKKNNLELIKGVDRATTTTVSALRTAVIVAQALANQKLVLDQINALNTTTGNVIAATSEMLKQQSAAVHEQAASSTIELEKLKLAFANIYETMDMVSNFKVQALDTMKQTVDSLGEEIEKSQKYLDRVRQEDVAATADELSIS